MSTAAEFYTGIVPDVYTVLRATTFDAARYAGFVRRAGQPALELGCGDAGPFVELVRQGFDIDGVDSSQDMLDRCHSRADTEGLPIVTYCQPMENLHLPRRYQTIYLAGPTFNLLPDDDTAYRALQGILNHLLPRGQAMVPLWIPNPTPAHEIGRTREARTADGSTGRCTIDSEDYDKAARTRRSDMHYELDSEASIQHVRRSWIIHWHTPDGFANLADSAGLEVSQADPVQDGEFTVFLRRPGTMQ